MVALYCQSFQGVAFLSLRQAEPPMEFACGYVYIPPSTNQREGQRISPNAFKRSALLPPLNRVRPRNPPPPPPTPSKEPEHPHHTPSQRIIGHITSNVQVGRALSPSPSPSSSPSPLYQNADFHLRGGSELPGAPLSQQITSQTQRRTALLPPNMKRSLNNQSQPYIQTMPATQATFFLNGLIYDLPKEELDVGLRQHPLDPNYSYNIPEGIGGETKQLVATRNGQSTTQKSASAPSLPPRPSFLISCPEYLALLPTSSTKSSSPASSSSSSRSPLTPPHDPIARGSVAKQPLPGNPNVILVSLGRLIAEENVLTIQGQPTSCSQCGSVLDSCYDNVVNVCYFCQSWEPATSSSPTPQPRCPPMGCEDSLFLLTPDLKCLSPSDALLLFCIDISGSMSITSQVMEGEHTIHRSRLEFVQEAVLQCVHKLRATQPHTRVGLITFNNQVTLHGYDEFASRFLRGAELIDSEYLKEAAFCFPSPPPLSRTRDCLQREILGLSECGATALGPAALLAIAMASRQPGSKVIICTDGKANTELGNLEVEDNDARTLLSSTIFYQDLGEYAAGQGVTVSVMSIEGTDCRLDELGRLADRTGGKVVIARPDQLHSKFEEMIENRTIATHCSVTLLLPKTLSVRGEREAGHRGTRQVGNVASNTEITFQFGAKEQQDLQVSVPGSCVSVQVQLRYRQRDGRSVLRVLTADRDVTDDRWVVLSSLSLAIIQLNSSQASAALAVRGRFLDARREGETQRQLIETALEHNRSAEDKNIYDEWVKTMEPIHSSIHNYTRRKSVISDTQSLTDMGAALLYNMKNSNRKSISLKKKQQVKPLRSAMSDVCKLFKTH